MKPDWITSSAAITHQLKVDSQRQILGLIEELIRRAEKSGVRLAICDSVVSGNSDD